jgi:two-component system sensor histidine kinase UhpB
MDMLVALNGVLFAPPADQSVVASVPRPQGPPWQARWVASHDYEQREALAQLAEAMLLLATCSLLVLAVMRWRMLQSFRPLSTLLVAIGRAERQDLSAVRALPAMPVRELDVIAGALRHLGGALEEAEAQRRQLAAQVQTLQEDERSRLARELHDELGQHLTALRVDAAWLQRRLAGQPELAAVVAGMSEQCERVQAEVRALLTRLRPLGSQFGAQAGASPGSAGGDGPLRDGPGASCQVPTHESAGRLRALLDGLVRAWAQSPGQHTRHALRFDVVGLPPEVPLPRELVLAVYRISQEALTNVARHARADEARLSVRLQAQPNGRALLHWSVEDDGCGLDAAGVWQRGNGLAGIKERAWAAGGDLGIEPLRPEGAQAGRPGLRLQAKLPFVVSGGDAGSDPATQEPRTAEVDR